jgi:hypothetical protein
LTLTVSILSSGLAGNERLRDRVLALIVQVGQGNSVDELDEMQREVDDILRETLDSYDDGAIQEGDLSVFSLALEQFHHAVADRKAGINGMASDRPRQKPSVPFSASTSN